jgi:monothiol glutaredoxin
MDNPVFVEIQKRIDSAEVLLFMKGTPLFPQCGFSARVVQVLKAAGVPFATVNVLEDPEIREGIKAFSNWPTIPQLYVKGEFVGGCDIVAEMYQSGELQTLLTAKGIQQNAA